MVVQEFDLNLIPSSAPVVIHVDQYDKGDNRLLIHLYDGDTPYVPETAATVEIQGVKPDTKGFQYYADIDGSTVTADVVMQMTACAGRVKTQIVVTETTGRTGTFDFILDVQESALPAIVDISETELPIIIEGAQAQADAAAASAAQAAVSEQLAAEHVAATAENANRAIAEANRAEAEADRAETSRAVAEDAEAWAVGERGGVPVEEGDETYENNAKWYSEQIQNEKEEAEAWAVGERGGVPVSSDDPTYHNNAKFWSDKSGTSRLVSLDDVAVASVQDGDLIHYDEEEGKWVNSKVNVEDLGNAEITNVQDGESLMYDDIKHKWVNKIASTKYIPKPTATGFVFTYDGTEQGPIITGLDPDWEKYITITGATATDAGTYVLRFSLRNTQLYAWSDFSTQDITYSWEIEKAVVTVPTVTANLTYNGSAQSPTITGFDSDTMDKYGDSETNAGDYNVTFYLLDNVNYVWNDDSVSDKDVPWSIAKAAGSVTLSANSVTLDADHLTATVTVSGATGAVSVTSSDATVATATIAGNIITISNVNENSGTATITVNVAASTNYVATSKTIAVTATFAIIYGVEWEGTSNSAWSRTDAASNFVNPTPAINNKNGSSPFDNIYPWSEMTKVEDATAGTLVKIPKFYYKLTQSGTKLKIQITDKPVNGFSISPAHMNRGDGKGERNVIYVSRYKLSQQNYLLKSTTNASPYTNTIIGTLRSTVHRTGDDIWIMDFATRFTIWLLYLVEFADWNSQKKIGYGCSPSGSRGSTGGTDNMTYHTGTSAANRTTYGWTQYRNIEGLWDNVFEWMDGCYANSDNMYVILNPNNFSNSTGGISVGSSYPPYGGDPYPSQFEVRTISGAFPLFMPTIGGGDRNSYSCDIWRLYNACFYAGGKHTNTLEYGLFTILSASTSSSVSDTGCRLMKLP